jgi:hypothetical protein
VHFKKPMAFVFESSFADLDDAAYMDTLGFAAEGGCLDFVQILLPICKKKAITINWASLFVQATGSKSEEVVEYLLDHIPEDELTELGKPGPNINLWHAAAKKGLGNIIQLLIASGKRYPHTRARRILDLYRNSPLQGLMPISFEALDTVQDMYTGGLAIERKREGDLLEREKVEGDGIAFSRAERSWRMHHPEV